MQVTNTIYYSDQDFADYLKLPGTSFSSLKGEIPVSAGMALGSRIHAYLNEPGKYDWRDAEMVLPIAKVLRSHVGDAFQYLQKEVAFTSIFEHNGMELKYKGRADLLKAGRIVIDFKILAGSLGAAIERFGYDKQLSGYCLGTGSPLGLIIAYNKSSRKVEVKTVKPSCDFWEYQTVRLGEPVKETLC